MLVITTDISGQLIVKCGKCMGEIKKVKDSTALQCMKCGWILRDTCGVHKVVLSIHREVT